MAITTFLAVLFMGQSVHTRALDALRGLPSYTSGPRIFLQMNGNYWYADPNGVAIRRELARVCGTTSLPVFLGATMPADRVRVARESGAPVWLEMNTLGGHGLFQSIEAHDPNYLHATTQPTKSYLTTQGLNSSKLGQSRFLYCPGRIENKAQVGRWYRAGQSLRDWGLTPALVGGVWVHCETARIAGLTGEYYCRNAVYSDCAACGSPEKYNAALAWLHEDCVTALLCGLCANAPAVPRFYWGSGYYQYRTAPKGWQPSPYYAGPIPRMSSVCWSSYYGDAQSLADLDRDIAYNAKMFGLPVTPFISLTYDAATGRETGIPYGRNWEKARRLAKAGCPLICGYALNEPNRFGPAEFEKEILAVLAIVDGSRVR